MLKIKGLYKVFKPGTVNEKVALRNIDLTLDEGDFVTVIGGNGAGKSTLLNCVAGVYPIDQGSILLDGTDITKMPEHKRAAFLGRVFQDPSAGVAPNMTILENMSMAYNKGNPFNLTWGISRKNISYFKDLLAEVNLGLENKLYNKVGILSGGQRQALSLIMAVMSKPKLLLLDEHTAALDPKTSETINEITGKIVSEFNMTTLMVTHNMNHAIKMGNRLFMMDQGKIILDVQGEQKKNLTVNKLLSHFESLNSNSSLSDRVLFA